MKNKEWLKNEIEIMGSETSENYPHEQMVDREVVLNLIDQLDEPELPVIPQFVADYIKVSKEDNESLNQAFAFIDDKENKELWNWMFPTVYEGKRENQESFARAWLDGYTIKPPKRWVVRHKDDCLYFEKFDEDKYDFSAIWTYLAEPPAFKFTDKSKAEAVATLVDGRVEEVWVK